jgi:Putative MetA-pathway of phenol degradation
VAGPCKIFRLRSSAIIGSKLGPICSIIARRCARVREGRLLADQGRLVATANVWQRRHTDRANARPEKADVRFRIVTEFHLEGAVIQHLPSGFSFGVGGYHYHQVTGDSGSGAVLGPFIGRVTAVGPVIGYVLKAGALPINLNARWFAEFETENRVRGNAVFASLTVPLHLFAPPTPPKVTK